jgi:hypothetical protein
MLTGATSTVPDEFRKTALYLEAVLITLKQYLLDCLGLKRNINYA